MGDRPRLPTRDPDDQTLAASPKTPAEQVSTARFVGAKFRRDEERSEREEYSRSACAMVDAERSAAKHEMRFSPGIGAPLEDGMGQREGMGGRGLLAGSAAFAAMGLAGAVHAQRIVYVDASNPSLGNGQSWQTAYSSLERALDNFGLGSVDAGVEVRIAGGMYRHTSNSDHLAWVSTLASGVSISINGGYAGRQSATPDERDFVTTRTTISCDVLGNDGPNFTGRADNRQFALRASSTNELGTIRLSVSGLTFRGATQTALSVDALSLTVSDCVFEDNRTPIRWAANNYRGLTVLSSTFERNAGVNGGAIEITVHDGSPFVLLQDCKFIANHAEGDGGAVWNPATGSNGARLSRCQFWGNTSAGSGGATSGRIWAYDCLFSGNTAGLNGGAIDSHALIRLCTITNNRAAWGGGVRFSDTNGSISSSILWGNSATLGGQQLAGGPPIQTLRTTVVQGGASGILVPFSPMPYILGLDYFELNPEFVDVDGPDGDPTTWQDNDWHLSPRSPYIDRSTLGTFGGQDLDRNTRSVQGIIGRPSRTDLGCYESQLTLCPSDIDADGGVTIDDLLDFLAAFELGQPLADLTTNGSTPFPDGGVTVDDLLFFLAKFEQGC